MKPGDMILTPVPQADGKLKKRPAIILKEMPGYGDFLVCGVSTQLQHYIYDFDNIISPEDEDFKLSGLTMKSLIRLGFLAIIPKSNILGTIGSISNERYNGLLKTLCNYLSKNIR